MVHRKWLLSISYHPQRPPSLTRCGILSTVSSIYDPLGFAAATLLEGKKILQELCRGKIDWDDPVSDSIRMLWEKWRRELPVLEKLSVPRCYKPTDFGRIASAELHHFSNASVHGYGQCSYLRLKNDQGQIHCSFVLGKARVTPLKPVTVPRLELTAAVVSIKSSEQLQRELDFEELEDVYWTDSQAVLEYIANETRRFHVLAANWVQQIQEHSSPSQWHYVDTKLNPADYTSWGLSAKGLLISNWITGPAFLWKEESCWHEALSNENQGTLQLSPDDPEVKKNITLLPTLKNPSRTCTNSWNIFQIFTEQREPSPFVFTMYRSLREDIPWDPIKHSEVFKARLTSAQ